MDLRLTAEQKDTIELAAQIEGTTASGFTVGAVMDRAMRSIERAKVVSLTTADWDAFNASLDEPTTPPAILELLAKPSVLEA